jgi:maltooligosyltrehalose trehalohydrolase
VGLDATFQYFIDHEDPQLAEAIRIGRRAEFAAHGAQPEEVPDPQDPATFARSVLDWSEPAQGDHAATLDWFRRLIALRRTHPELGAGKATASADYDEDSGLVRVERGRVTVVANLGAAELAVRLGSASVLIASSGPGVLYRSQVLHLPPDCVAIVQRGD